MDSDSKHILYNGYLSFTENYEMISPKPDLIGLGLTKRAIRKELHKII